MLKLAGLATAAAIAAFTALEPSILTSTPAVTSAGSSLVPSAEPDLVLRGALARAGLAPESLAAAGVNAPQAEALANRTASHDVVAQARLGPADAALADAKANLATLERAVREGDREPSTLQALDQARTVVASAEAAVEGHLDALFAEAVSGLEPAVVARLEQIDANGRYRRLPLEFLVVDRSVEQWAELRECLTHERVCTRRGDETDPALMSALAAARASQDVSAAKTRLDANLAAVEAAWMAATTSE